MGISSFLKIGTAISVLTFTAACENGIDLGRLATPFQRTTDAIPSIDRPAADRRGVITYESYQVIEAREGDSISAMASRVGLSATELANTNGLPESYRPRAGELLVLPQNVGGSLVVSPSGWSADIAETAIENATPRNQPPAIGSPTNPLRHRVESGETAFEIARRYNVSVTALASWNGLGPNLGIRTGQQLIIPVADTNSIAAPTPAPTPSVTAPAPRAPVVTPPTPEPAPPAPTPEPTPEPTAATNAPFVSPVSGTIARGYQPTGRNKNEGLDYATAAGATVVAADAGTVALVSDSLGGLGTIVLIRHSNDLMTVYGRVTDVTVTKGDTVRQGQSIGKVAPADTPIMHFEVRVGTESVDPTRYLQ